MLSNLFGEASLPEALMWYSINTAVPFLVFGFLDNSLMLVGGETIEATVGATLNLSPFCF